MDSSSTKEVRKAAASGEILRLENQLCFPLYAATNLLGKLYAPLLTEMDLTYPQYLVMLVLWEISPLSVGEVGSKLYLDSGTLTPLLKRLELKGLIYRQRDKTDERRVLIHLTEKGKVLKKKAASIPVALADRLNLDLDEAKRLRCSVKELVQLIQRQLHHVDSV